MRCTSNLFRALSRLGVDISVYTTNANGHGGVLSVPIKIPVDVGGVKVSYFPSTLRASSVWDSRSMIKALKRSINDFDIVYISAIWQWIGIAAGRIAKKAGIPYVVGTHGSFDRILMENGKIKKMVFWKIFLSSMVKSSRAIHYTTVYERSQSISLSRHHPNFIVPNCMSNESFEIKNNLRNKYRRDYGIPVSVPVITNIGRPDPKKRYDLILKSFKIIQNTFSEARLLLVGPTDNDYATTMMKTADDLKISSHVIWAGFREGDELKACYTAADVFLLPSMDENFGMVVTEAMAAGLPVVVTKFVGVSKDVAINNAGIVAELNEEEIANEIICLFKDPVRLNILRENAKRAAFELYRDEKVASLMLQAFQDVLNQKRSYECQWQ